MQHNQFIDNYLESIHKQFLYYKQLGEKTFSQLTEEECLLQKEATENSIAIIVNHISGNMLSRWTDFLTTDGEKDFRNRDREFDSIIQSKKEMIDRWEEGWACLFHALTTVNTENFGTTIYIRNMGHTITEAINRQLAHYAYHIGQIVILGVQIKKENWESLSIPKGASKSYNEDKFSQPKRRQHFTDDFLEK